MKRFFKLNVFALVALLFLGVADVWGWGIKKNVALNLDKEGGHCSWDGSKLSWTESTWNLYKFTDWDNSDLSGYDKMVINVSNATPNKTYRVVITIDGTLYTYSTSGNGTKEIDIRKDFKNGNSSIQSISGDPLTKVESIRIGGSSDNGSITINSIYFHKPLQWDANNKITFSAQDFNLGANVTAGNPSNNFTFSKQWADISLDFDSDGLATTELESVTVNISGSGTYQCFQDKERKERVNWGETLISRYNLNDAQENNINLGRFMICADNDNVNITLNSVTFTKKKNQQEQPNQYVFDVTQGRLYFEDFEDKTQASLHPESEAPAANARPDDTQVGKYYLYGGRGKILKDPTFGQYYQNLADADEYTKSLSQNFLRYIFTDDERKANVTAIRESGAATIGFWVNGQVAVDYELPLERGSMFCIFSNDCFAKADAGNIRPKDRPRFMFDLSCNGWVYSYMPNTLTDGTDIGINYFFYGEKYANSGVQNPLGSLFGKNNYTNTLDQSKHKFYDDKKWHYVTYVMDNNLTRVQIYLDGNLTGTVENVTALPNTDHSECQFEDLRPHNGIDDRDYIGRTEYLRNIVLGGLTPHGLFYDQQYYSDAALAYDDIAMYGRALTQDEIRSIIEQKNYAPAEWHYGDSFAEYNASKGGNEDPHNISGLGVNGSFDETTGYLTVNQGMLTIPNVPKGYYVRVEYKGTLTATKSADEDKFAYVGLRTNENRFRVATYKAEESGTYHLKINSQIKIRSIVITPYQYATLKYGNMEYDEDEEEDIFIALKSDNKYVAFNVTRSNSKNTFTKDGKEYDDNSVRNVLPVLTLNVDGQHEENDPSSPIYKKISDYTYSEGKKTYIKYSSTSPHVAFIDNRGKITLTGIAGNTTIIAELISDDNLYNGSEVIDSYEIRVMKEGNTLRLENNEVVTVNEKFEDLNNITLTIGGWQHTDTYNVPGVGPVSDSWTNAQYFADPIIGSNGVLDGFDQFTIGTHVAKSESLGNDDGNFYPKKAFAHNVTPWTLPCRGGYVKFEPLKAGVVTMYLRQTGNLYDKTYDKGHSRHVAWRPIYITDETGKVVDFVQTATNGLITYEDNFFVGDKRRAQFIESIAATYNGDASLRQDLLNLKSTDYEKFRILIDNWNNAGWRQKVIPTGDGGYMVMSDAIVRYTFNVLPGKTYYLFSNDTQVAISGFNFEQNRLLNTEDSNYETSPVRFLNKYGTGNGQIRSIEWTDDLNSQPEIPTNINDDVTKVTYKRTFTQGKWSSICLPFSMNNRQMREQFGDETAVVLLKTIHDDGKMELIWHVNQDIIAGYPYFILPKGYTKNAQNGVISKIQVETSFRSGVKNTNPLISIGSDGKTFDWKEVYAGGDYNGDYPYVFEGNFKNEELPAGSYVMSNNGTLTKLKTATIAKPFRAYLKYQGSNSSHAKPLYTSINWQEGEETTAINDIIFQNGILMESSDVYGVDGSIIRHDAQNLKDLSKGVYIVNGKKFVVK